MSNILTGTFSEKNIIRDMINDTVKKINNINDVNKSSSISVKTVDISNFNSKLDLSQVYSEYNDFITEEIQKTHAKVEEEISDINQMMKLEDLLCEKSTLFSSLINELQEQIQKDIIIHPTKDINEKTEKKIHDIIMSFKDFDQKLLFLEKDIKSTIFENVAAANLMINHIQIVNRTISHLYAIKDLKQIKSLARQRDALIEKLNKIIGVKVIQQDENCKVLLNNDIILIDNDKKQNLSVITSKSNPSYISIGYTDKSSKNPIFKNIEYALSSGPIKSLLRFRREEINNARNKIGQLTINFAKHINSYHMLGYNKYGEIGTEFIKIGQPEIIVNSLNKRPVLKSILWADIDHAQSSDYQVSFKDNKWIVKRLSDNTIIKSINLNEKNENSFTSLHFDGMIFNIDSSAYEGDSYIIKPYSQVLNKLELMIDKKSTTQSLARNNPRKIQTDQDFLMNNGQTLDQAYQTFTKSIIYQRRFLEDGLPFKIKLLDVLKNKQISISSNPDQDYKNLTFQQKCYMANTQILKTAESILNDIIAAYS